MNLKKQNLEIKTYLFVTFFLTWIIWLMILLEIKTIFSDTTLILLGTFVPSLAALILEYKIKDKRKFLNFLKNGFNFKIKLKSYLYIFLISPLIMFIAYSILNILELSIPKSDFPLQAFPLVFIYIMLFMGPLGEEFGWRGFLLKRILNKKTLFNASIILGLIWTVWHLPLFFINNTIQSQLVANYDFALVFLGYALYTIIITIQISILYIKTNGSIFASILFHTMANATLGMLPLILFAHSALVLLLVMTLVTAVLVIINKEKIFSLTPQSI